MTFVSGLAGTFQPLLTRLENYPRLFSALVPLELYQTHSTVSVLVGFSLIYLSLNLLRRKRNAWWIALLLTALSLVLERARWGTIKLHELPELASSGINTQDWQSLPYFTFIPAVVSLAALIYFRKYFTVRSEKTSISGAILAVSLSLVAILIYGTAGFFLLDRRDFGLDFSLADSFYFTLQQLIFSPSLQNLIPHSKYGIWFLSSLHWYTVLALTYIAFSAFRPVHYYLTSLPQDRARAAEILNESGRTSLDLFKLLPDKSYFFNREKNGFIAYKTDMAVAIALGDATAPPEKTEALIADFTRFAHDNGWLVAFLQTTPDMLDQYRKAGLRSLKIGEDAVVDLQKFNTSTVNKKTFKSVLKKFDKEGYKLVKYSPPHSPELLAETRQISDAWLKLPGRRERGFSLGQYDDKDMQANNVYVLRDAENKAIAFVNQIKSYVPGEATIDMMRYPDGAPNGTMDCLFAKLLKSLEDDGYKTFSLGLAALSGVGDEPDDNLHEKAMNQVYEHFNRFFSYKGLRTYKNKFEPVWLERYLIYEGRTPQLVKTGIAIARATEE